MTIDIWKNDKAGNCKKAFFVKKYHPQLYEEILLYAKNHKLEYLSFYEKCYMYRFNHVPEIKNGTKQHYKGMTKHYSVKFIENVEDTKRRYYQFSPSEFLKTLFSEYSEIENDNGKISQILQAHDRFEAIIEELQKQTSFLDELNPSLRHRIYAVKHRIKTIPKCKCGKNVKLQDTRGCFCNSCGDKKCYYMMWNCSGKKKEFELPSGLVIKTQGFENLVIKELLKHYDEHDILIDDFDIRKEIGIISFKFEGKTRKYYPDIYIKSENTIIEVKSDWTFNRRGQIPDEQNSNIMKAFASIKHGINFMFWIFNTDGTVNKIKIN